jgi:hypothetical protein
MPAAIVFTTLSNLDGLVSCHYRRNTVTVSASFRARSKSELPNGSYPLPECTTRLQIYHAALHSLTARVLVDQRACGQSQLSLLIGRRGGPGDLWYR